MVDLRSRFFEEIKCWESYLKPGYSQRTGLEDKIDNYDKTVFSESGIPGPEIFPFPFRSGEKLQYYFQINDESGKLLLYSEGYESAQGRDKGLLSVLRNSYYLPRYVIVKDAEQYGFRLYAGNRQEISRSWLFYTLEELKSKICWLRSQLADWQVMLGVRPSWLMIRQVKILIEKKQLPLIPPVPDLAESETPGEGPQPEVEGEELTDETEPEVIPGEIVEEEHIVERGIPDEDSVYPEEKEPEAEEEEPVEEELEPPYVP